MSLLKTIGVTVGASLLKSIFSGGDKDETTSKTDDIVSTSSTKKGLMTAPKTIQKFAPSRGSGKKSAYGSVAGSTAALKAEDPQSAARRMAAIFAQAKQMSQTR